MDLSGLLHSLSSEELQNSLFGVYHKFWILLNVEIIAAWKMTRNQFVKWFCLLKREIPNGLTYLLCKQFSKVLIRCVAGYS